MSVASNRVIVMTGGTAGIGKAALKQLALGNLVIFGARSADKGESLVKDLASIGREIVYFPLDVSKPDSIQAFAAKVLEHLQGRGIDVLLLNAGAYFHRKKVHEELGNVEHTILTNHFGGHMLFELLKGAMKLRFEQTKGTGALKPRVVAVSSLGHTDDPKLSFWHPPVGKFDFSKSWDSKEKKFKTVLLSGKKKYKGPRAYTDSKLLNGLFARKITRTYGDFLDAVFVNPGFTPGSEFGLLTSTLSNRILKNLIPILGWQNSVPQAGNVLNEACLRSDIQSGEYYTTHPDVKNPERFGLGGHNPEADDEEKQDQLYQIGLDLIETYTDWKLPLDVPLSTKQVVEAQTDDVVASAA